jgi:hypothetical protein
VTRRSLLSASGAALARRAAASRPPGIVPMTADDLSARERGCYGRKTRRNPNRLQTAARLQQRHRPDSVKHSGEEGRIHQPRGRCTTGKERNSHL